MEILNDFDWLNKIADNEKILLINPPVYEVRYAWSRWNQPVDLLRLSSKLKVEKNCDIELLDFMLPEESGRIPFKNLGRERNIGENDFEMKYRLKYYGMPLNEAALNLRELIANWKPSQIVISTLTTYWYDSLVSLIPVLKTIIPDVKITIIGGYGVYETEHASRLMVDYIVNDFINYEEFIPDYNIYKNKNTKILNSQRDIKFGGLVFTKNNVEENIIKQMRLLLDNNIKDFVYFEGNIFKNQCSYLENTFELMKKNNIKANFYGLCGIELDDMKDGIFKEMLNHGYKSFFIEENIVDNELNIENYLRVYRELVTEAPKTVASGSLAGFTMIGTPKDNLEKMFKNTLNILEICGSVIPKPYTPSPNTPEYEYVSQKNIQFLSPHVFPMAEVSGITRIDYVEFYKHTTFLNEKRQGKSFDFFDESYASVALKNSLKKKV